MIEDPLKWGRVEPEGKGRSQESGAKIRGLRVNNAMSLEINFQAVPR
jgi:hypothetical protein